MEKIIAIVGGDGKMGTLVSTTLNKKYKVEKITLKNKLQDYKKIDFVIDFACAKSSVESAKFCQTKNIPILIASTGQNEKQLKKLYEISKNIPMMICSNLSIGVAQVKKIINSIDFSRSYDISIIEKHHREKKDMPSGTAIMLKKFLNEKTKDNIEIISERGGKEIGTHTIDFYFDDELISITHKAFSRNCFALGALKATDFMIKQTKPGLYYFDDII